MDLILDLDFLSEVGEARRTATKRKLTAAQAATFRKKEKREHAKFMRDARSAGRKKTTRKSSTRKASRGRGAPGRKKSVAHRKAISAGMRKYWRSGAAKSRRRSTTKRKKTTRKTSRKAARRTGSVRVGKKRTTRKPAVKGYNSRGKRNR